MRAYAKTAFIAAQVIVAVTAVSIIAGSVFHGGFNVSYVFPANYLAGAVIIFAGLMLLLIPVRLKDSKLIDHTTYGMAVAEQRAEKRKKASRFIVLGLSVTVLTAVIQLLLSVIIRV